MVETQGLRGVLHADACIVGGGWTGLLTAFLLSRQRLSVILVEQGTLGEGSAVLAASLNQPHLLRQISVHHGPEAARDHLRRMRGMMDALPGFLAPLTAFHETDDYLYARRPEELPALLAAQELLSSLGLAISDAPDAGGCPFPLERSLLLPRQLLINGDRLTASLISRIREAGGQVFGRARVINASAKCVFLEKGRIETPLVLLCTGKPIGLASRSLLSALESRTVVRCDLQAPIPLHTLQHSALPEGLTLFPSPSGAETLWDAGRTGSRMEARRVALFRRILHHRLPDFTPGNLRFSQSVRTLDGLPIVGGFQVRHGRILCASGASDFLSAFLSAEALARLALRIPTEDDLAFRPDRQLSRRSLRGAYRHMRTQRALNALRQTAPRCSHCATRLRYLSDAEWWGCSFCGSVFGIMGRRLSGPALRDAAISPSQRPGW